VDRRALPAPEFASAGGRYAAPTSELEEALCRIWAEVLGVERVGVHDDFFESGGHSLLATRLASRIQQEMRVELPLRTVFEAPTVAGLAEVLAAGSVAAAAPIGRVPRDGDLPASFAQQRLWFIDQMEPESTAYTIPLGLVLGGPLDARALERALGEIVRRHEVLRTTFVAPAGKPLQRVAPAMRLPLARRDLSRFPEGEREDEVRRAAAKEMARTFDLAEGPLVRAVLLRLGEEEHVLLVTMHHIVTDGWSMGVLARELTAIYPAFAQGLPSPLPELEIQYGDFAAWQRGHLTGAVLTGSSPTGRRGSTARRRCWSCRPTGRARRCRATAAPCTRSPSPRTCGSGCGRSPASAGGTPFMVLLAAFQLLLGRYGGKTDVVVGSPIANRNRAEIEGLIGFFVNTLALRTDLSGDPTFRELLARVRETTLGAYAHQDLPFERLVEELRVERSLARTPSSRRCSRTRAPPKRRWSCRGCGSAGSRPSPGRPSST
jgi:acyl carrier protein